MGCVTGCSFSGFVWVVFGFCLVLFVLFGGSFLAVGMQPVLQLLLNSNKVTCAEPAHIAPRLVQKNTGEEPTYTLHRDTGGLPFATPD